MDDSTTVIVFAVAMMVNVAGALWINYDGAKREATNLWTWGALTLLFSAIITVPLWLATRPRLSPSQRGMTTCPSCAEEVKEEAVVCKHCGRDLLAKRRRTRDGIVVDEGF